MRNKGFLKTKGFYVVIFLLILFILYPLDLFGQEENPEKALKVEIKDNLVSVNVEDADLSEVLNEIGKRIGVKVTVGRELVGNEDNG
ncbi:MAG: hypothetical protein M0Z67_18940 [Nitrospiraceae bacterium]|nr:hypothetical protein [Nitrospiraceae bacterium]